ncbi:MAG: phosphatase PAP2 family protein [Owenweeksia sp.]
MFNSKLLRQNLFFLIPVLIFIITGIVFLVLFPKDIIHITQNGWYSPSFDYYFKYVTYLGDGIAFLGVAIALMFVKWRYVMGFALVALLTLFTTGILKNVVYKGQPRPSKYFENIYELRVVEGVELHQLNSFPSGHTTSAFACWGFVAFLLRSRLLKFGMFLLAGSVGYSRIYLSQHFLEDVVAGAALGTLIALVSYIITHRFKKEWNDRRLVLKRKSR